MTNYRILCQFKFCRRSLMISKRYVFLILALVICHQAHADILKSFNIFDDNEMTELTDTAFPWQTVGRLDKPDGSHCTATLIDKNIIVTAAHCFVDGNSHEIIKGDYQFQPGMKHGGSTYSSGITTITVGTKDPDNDRAHDWALAKLEQPLGEKVGWMGMTSMPNASQKFGQKIIESGLTMVGYGEDFMYGHTPSVESNCGLKGFDSNLKIAFHNCSTSKGSSGGPIFVSPTDGSSHQILAINVAERRHGSDSSLTGIPYSENDANIAIFVQLVFKAFEELRHN